MEFRQVYTPGLAHCSYVIGGKNECVVVDPSRSVDRYIQIAESFKLPITAIIETHLHADFISGGTRQEDWSQNLYFGASQGGV